MAGLCQVAKAARRSRCRTGHRKSYALGRGRERSVFMFLSAAGKCMHAYASEASSAV